MRQYLLLGTVALVLVALAAPADAHGSRRYRTGVVRRVHSSRPGVYRVYGRRYSRPVVYRSYNDCDSPYGVGSYGGRRRSRTVIYRTRRSPVYYVDGGYGHDRLHDRLERRHERAHIRGFRSRAEHRRFHIRQQRAHERAHRLRVRRVGWGRYDRGF